MKPEEYILDRTITKRPCIYARIGNALYPILYFQKAKGAPDEEFEKLLDILVPNKEND